MTQQVILNVPGGAPPGAAGGPPAAGPTALGGATGRPLLDITVRGLPVGQGNLRHLGRGRPAIHQNAKELKPWREAIRSTAAEAMGDVAPFDGPLALLAMFTVRKPASAPKRRLSWPDRRPDLDHLLRAVGDALTGVAITDDSRLIDVRTGKRYPGERVGSLPYPGVLIRLYAVDGSVL